jgi:hypothetical protein
MTETLDEFNQKLRSGYYHLVKEDYEMRADGEKYIFYLQLADLGSRLLKLKEEQMKLRKKTARLGEFLKTSECHMLSQREQYLLVNQWNAMSDYLNTLEEQIKLIKERLQ